jgi:acetyl esterase/lipase
VIANTGRVSTIEFHPELRRVAQRLPKQIVTPVTVPFIRAAERLLWRRNPKDVDVLTLASGVGIRLFRPPGVTGQAPALLWIHGGGYVIGKAAQDDVLCRRYARKLGATVASVDYRLAPDHPYPAPVEDCYSALQWLVRLPSVDPSRVAIGGASAGGGLAAALALLTRDRGEINLTAQLLVYPMLDDRTVDRKGLENPGLRLWNQTSNKYGWMAYSAARTRRWPCPHGARTSVGRRLRGWVSARSTCFTMRTWPTPSD